MTSAGDLAGDVLSTIVAVDEIPWRAEEAGISHKELWTDPASHRALFLRRLEPGVRLLHRHIGQELIFVLEGAVSDEHGIAAPGMLASSPPGCTHTESSEQGATVLVHSIGGGSEPAHSAGDGPRSERFAPHDMDWKEDQPGTFYKKMWSDPDPSVNRRVALMRFEPGAAMARHRHLGNELIFVIEGSLTDEAGDVTAGNIAYRPSGCVHTVGARNGATFLAFATGSSEPA